MKKVFIMFLVFAYLNCYMGCSSKKMIIFPVNELYTESKEFDVTFDELSPQSKELEINLEEIVQSTDKYSIIIITNRILL